MLSDSGGKIRIVTQRVSQFFSVFSASGGRNPQLQLCHFRATNAAVGTSIPAAVVSGVGAVGVLEVSAGPAALCLRTVHDSMGPPFGVAASASLSPSVALLNLTILVRLASSVGNHVSAISSPVLAASSSALVVAAPAAVLFLCAASDALVSDAAA